MELLKGLNDSQKEAVVHTEGPLLILAGAGSGKTRVLTHRIAYLIKSGVPDFNILAITFTNKASKEMRIRVDGLIGKGNYVWISTFHSACIRILRQEIKYIDFDTNFNIYDQDDSQRLLKTCVKQLDINEKQFPVKSVAPIIGSFKDSLMTPQRAFREYENDYRMSVYAKIYSLYQKKLKENNSLDFDDIIFKTVELFHTHPEILEKYQNRFKYIMVDEYQDTNTAQYTFIKQLSSKYKNLCVVGDDDQSIYGWRGANIRNILEFEKDFENTKVIKLEENYRSTQTILNAANSIIENNYNRKDKSLWTSNIEGESIKIYNASTDIDESIFLSEIIKDRVTAGKKYSDFAILYRTNAQSRIIEDTLVRKDIPYRLFGGVRFYERKEIKDILSYLKVIYNSRDSIAFKRIINVPKRGLGNVTLDRIDQYANDEELSFYDALKNFKSIPKLASKEKQIANFISMLENLKEKSQILNVSDLINFLIKETGYLDELNLDATELGLGRVENVNELINKAVEFERNSENKSLQGFLEDIALVADIDNYDEDADTVVLMTMHSSKGLEFKTVFITGMEESIFPTFRSVMSPEKKDLEEERRLCYVGITRAEENLFLTFANSRMRNGEIVYNAPSRFLKEISPILTEKVHNSNIFGTQTIIKSKKKETTLIENNLLSESLITPKNIILDFEVGDNVLHAKYGVGKVLEINKAGADFEVTVSFPDNSIKKFMAMLSKLKKSD